MNILDNLEKIKQIDIKGILKAEEEFYDQLIHARDIASKTDISSIQGKSYKGVVFLGMGGSGFSGDLIKDLIKYEAKIPIETIKGYDLPAYINGEWLVVAFSYSGNTEETIAALNTALERGCSMLAVTSGGHIEKIAKKGALVKVPGGYQPRAASAYLFFPVYLILAKLKIFKANQAEIDEFLSFIKQKAEDYSRNSSFENNDAKKLAWEIGKRLPVIYGTEGPLASVAYRWKCEFNENAKCPAFNNQLPEMNHNEVVGWHRLIETTKDFALIVFNDSSNSEVIKKRIEVTVNLIKQNFGLIINVEVEGNSPLTKTLSTMYLGDIASVYLAILNGVDPAEIDKIDKLKAELAKLN